jgi:hypothetical protein
MKTGFKDRLEVKGQEKRLKSPWNYECPQYDERSSCYINAGGHYGIGVTQPVGKMAGEKGESVVPKGRINTMKIAEVPHRDLPLDIEL